LWIASFFCSLRIVITVSRVPALGNSSRVVVADRRSPSTVGIRQPENILNLVRSFACLLVGEADVTDGGGESDLRY
jgi:hypothetical protein